MENIININDYVRTIGGYIYKAKKIYENRIWVNNNEFILPGIIAKHSFNIIDLIEERRLCKWRKSY